MPTSDIRHPTPHIRNPKSEIFTAAHFRAHSPLQFHGRLITAGEVRNAIDKPAGIFIPALTLETAVSQGQFNNIACFIDHAGYLDGPSLRDLFGVWTDIYYNVTKQSVDGTLNIYDTDTNRQIAAIFAQTLAPDQPSPDIGVSIVFYGDWQPEGPSRRALTRFHKIESADLVFMPASSGSRILEALSALGNRVFPQNPVSNSTNTQGELLMPDKSPNDPQPKEKIPHSELRTPHSKNPKSVLRLSETTKSEDTIPNSELRI